MSVTGHWRTAVDFAKAGKGSAGLIGRDGEGFRVPSGVRKPPKYEPRAATPAFLPPQPQEDEQLG